MVVSLGSRSEKLPRYHSGTAPLALAFDVLAQRENTAQIRLGAREKKQELGSQKESVGHGYLAPGDFAVQLTIELDLFLAEAPLAELWAVMYESPAPQ